MDSSQRVTTSTPASLHQPSRSAIFAAPDPVPVVDVEKPASRAHRRLPSRISPTCRGRAAAPATCLRSVRSYAAVQQVAQPHAASPYAAPADGRRGLGLPAALT